MAQLLSNLPIGAKVKFGKYSVNGETAQPIIWLIVAKNHNTTPAYPSNSITLLTQKVVDIRALDAKEPNNRLTSDRVNGGNNRYSISNLNQWLNSNGAQWYSATHGEDQAPTNATTGNFGTGYDTRPGFLNSFTSQEIQSILQTTIRSNCANIDNNVGYDDFVTKVFIPSSAEVGYSDQTPLGSLWEYFGANSRMCTLTPQAYTYSLCNAKPGAAENCQWWLREVNPSSGSGGYSAFSETSTSLWAVMMGKIGVRPALNVSNTLKVSDFTDNDGAYVVTYNSQPYSPSTITLPPTVYGGKINTITWGKSTDPDGDALTYQLECSINGGAYTQIYNGTALSYAHLVTFGTKTVTYRVKATDTQGASSDYTTSSTITVVNNNAPVISGTDSNLGVKSKGFTGTYTITDADNNAVTVTESIDGVQIRSFVATLGATITYGITDDTWLTLPNGSHTLTIRATDGLDSSVRNFTFTKLVDSFSIENSVPLQSTNMPTRIMMVVTRVIPSGATFKVEVCNNGYDSSPKWEDATSTVVSGRVYPFNNTTKTASNWGVKYRITVNRNGATGACYVSEIGGNFE